MIQSKGGQQQQEGGLFQVHVRYFACLFGLVALVVINLGTFAILDVTKSSSLRRSIQFSDTTTTTSVVPPITVVDGGATAATGKVFEGTRIRRFTEPRYFDSSSLKRRPQPRDASQIFPPLKTKCHSEQWAVVTTIFEPSNAIQSTCQLQNWCLLIVGDTKTPDDLYKQLVDSYQNVIYLSASYQKTIQSDYVQSIPFASFARKNIGYLYAIAHGATVIYDFDDDNELKKFPTTNMTRPPWDIMACKHRVVRLVKSPSNSTTTNHHAFNPLPLMKPTSFSWPRGFPLELIRQEEETHPKEPTPTFGQVSSDNIGVIQLLADHDPDVDAIYRLTRHLPLYFDFEPSTAFSLLVPPTKYAPYNAQSTVHFHKAFWGLFLPFTVHGRVSDIWRSYICQRLFHEMELGLVYAPPLVTQIRNSHDYRGDLNAESDLYQKAGVMVEYLATYQWNSTSEASSIESKLEELWIDLYEHDYIELGDVLTVQQWLVALLEVGYEFPPLRSTTTTKTVPTMPISNMVAHQPFAVGPPRYSDPYQSVTPQDEKAWNKWSSAHLLPSFRVVQLVVHTYNEGPALLSQWIYYHGELLGFANLIVLDSSTDVLCTAFLVYARDNLGIQVIFSQIATHTKEMQSQIAKSSDLILRLEPFEFLALGPDECLNHNCTLSPFGVVEYLNSLELDGTSLALQYVFSSVPDKKLCDQGRENKLCLFAFSQIEQTNDTTARLFDSRTFNGTHLMPPFDKNKETTVTRLGLFNVESRCAHLEAANSLRHVVRSGMLNSTSFSNAMMKELLKQLPYSRKQLFNVEVDEKYRHAVQVAQHIADPDKFSERFYQEHKQSSASRNKEFQTFLEELKAKYLTFAW